MLVTRSDSINSVSGRRLFYAPCHGVDGSSQQRSTYDKERLGVSSNPKKRPSRQSNPYCLKLSEDLWIGYNRNTYSFNRYRKRNSFFQFFALGRRVQSWCQSNLVRLVLLIYGIVDFWIICFLFIVVRRQVASTALSSRTQALVAVLLPTGQAAALAIRYHRWRRPVLWPFVWHRPLLKFRTGGGINSPLPTVPMKTNYANTNKIYLPCLICDKHNSSEQFNSANNEASNNKPRSV